MKRLKRRVLSFFLVLALLFSLSVSVFAAETEAPGQGEALYEKLELICEILETYSLESDGETSAMKHFLTKLFEEDPALFDQLADALIRSYDDKYSHYIPAGEYETSYPTQNTYVGIGITLKNGAAEHVIEEVAASGPAEAAGLLAGDVIVRVDGAPVADLTTSELVALLRGEAGTAVNITVSRAGAEQAFTVTRAAIGIPNTSHENFGDGVEYLKFNRFTGLETFIDFVHYYTDMPKNGSTVLIMDLRDNPGGDVALAFNILNRLIPDKDVTYIGVQTNQGISAEKSDGIGIALNKILILVNENSASAAEIIAGSLSELGYAELIGTTTYGKGKGQVHAQFGDGSYAVVTSQKYLLPTMKEYDDIGLTPQHEVHNVVAPYPMPEMEALNLQKCLYPTNYSTEMLAVQQRLVLLGYMDGPVYGSYDDATQAALTRFQHAHGLGDPGYVTQGTLLALDAETVKLSKTQVLVDEQLSYALELARKYAAEPAKYTTDEFGNFTNIK